jgi:hypothetical protein
MCLYARHTAFSNSFRFSIITMYPVISTTMLRLLIDCHCGQDCIRNRLRWKTDLMCSPLLDGTDLTSKMQIYAN